MPHAEVNITKEYHAGNTFHLNPVVSDADDRIVSINGATVVWRLYEDESDPMGSTELKKTTANGGVRLTDPTNGQLQITIEAGDTDGMGGIGGKEWFHRCDLTDDAGRRSTIFHGKFYIHP